jgi:biotin carboxyl carrier protein
MGIDRYVRVPAKRGAKAVEIAVEPAGEDRFVVTVDGRRFELDAHAHASGVAMRHEGRSLDARVVWEGSDAVVTLPNGASKFEMLDARTYALKSATGAAGGSAKPVLNSPMAGKIILVKVVEGDAVKEGQTLVIIEAMKMENELRCLAAGKVVKVAVAAGDIVKPGDKLLELAYDAQD